MDEALVEQMKELSKQMKSMKPMLDMLFNADIMFDISYCENVHNNNYNDLKIRRSAIQHLMQINSWDQHHAVYYLVCQANKRMVVDYEKYGHQFIYIIKDATMFY